MTDPLADLRLPNRAWLQPLPSWSSDLTWATFPQGKYHVFVHGVELQKSAEDLERYRELIEISQPDLVIETGTRRGGSALWFADHGLQVITLDLDPSSGQEAREATHPHDPNIHYFGGYSSIDIPAWGMESIQAICKGKRVMVSLDSDHHAPHVVDEIRMWLQFVTPGCYLVVEDACFDMWDADRARVGGHRIPEMGGPLPAINECVPLLLERGFWRDESLEGRFPVSHSPVGWWRRND